MDPSALIEKLPEVILVFIALFEVGFLVSKSHEVQQLLILVICASAVKKRSPGGKKQRE